MALNVRDDNENVEIRTADQRGQAPTGGAAQGTSTGGEGTKAATHTMRGVNRLLGRVINRNSGSEQVQNLRRLMEKELEDRGLSKDEFAFISIDPSQYSVPYPSLAVMRGVTIDGRYNAYAYIFPLVSGLAPLPRREEQSPHGNIMVPRTWIDNLNQTYIREVHAALASNAPTNAVTKIAGIAVVTNEINADSAQVAHNLLAAADNAIQSTMAMQHGAALGIPSFNLGWMTGDQPISNVQFNASGMQDSDIIGNPIRSDVTVTISNRIRQAISDYDSQLRLIATTGFVDLTYSPQDPQQQMIGAAPTIINGMLVPQTVQYQPRYIMTSMYPLELDAFTPELMVLGIIGTVATLNTGMTWVHSFIQAARKGMGPNNPGALAMCLDEETTAPIDLSNLEDDKIYKFLQTVLYPTLLYSIDIPEEGEYSWLLGMIPRAEQIVSGKDEMDRPVFSAGYNALYNAFDNATLGRFAAHYQRGKPLVYSTGNRIALGHYNHADNRRHDVRDLDDLYMMNMTNPDIVEAWEDSYDTPNQSSSQRVITRHDIIDKLLSNSWEQTGWAMRYDLEPEAIKALLLAAADCGFTIRPENIQRLAGSAVRGNAAARARGMGNVEADIYARNGRGTTGTNTSGGAFNLF